MGRATQGVRVINLRSGDSIASVAVVPAQDEKDSNETTENESDEITQEQE
jgi:DNA gyrase subunit A